MALAQFEEVWGRKWPLRGGYSTFPKISLTSLSASADRFPQPFGLVGSPGHAESCPWLLFLQLLEHGDAVALRPVALKALPMAAWSSVPDRLERQ